MERGNFLTVAAFICLGLLLWAVVADPLIPDNEDCAARRQAECWKRVFDEAGKLIR